MQSEKVCGMSAVGVILVVIAEIPNAVLVLPEGKNEFRSDHPTKEIVSVVVTQVNALYANPVLTLIPMLKLPKIGFNLLGVLAPP
ncbi:hypothetical protein [Nostoc sp.]|uniref:hypothetical protein n=1 Tax=Nostoc sp. TaxID=1180 RepID=UPI002FF70C09